MKSVVVSHEVLQEVDLERERQDSRFGEQNHPDFYERVAPEFVALMRLKCDEATRAGCLTWQDVLTEEFTEAMGAQSEAELRAELVQVAAVAVAWVESIDRRASRGRRETADTLRPEDLKRSFIR